MPIYDRIKVDCYEETIKDTFNIDTKGQDTLMFGSGLNSILNEIQNLIYNTIFYGSITHLKLCREVISNVMYSYSKIYGNEEFYKITLKMLALSGEYKEYRKLCLYLGDSFNFWYSKDFINEITSLKNKTLDYKKINYNNFIYGFYGKYLNDKDYTELEQSVLEYLRNIEKANVNLVPEIFKNIKASLLRTNRINEIMDSFENYFDNKISLPLIIDCLKVVGFTKKRDEVILNQIYCFYISVSEKDYISKLETIDLLSVFANTKYEIKILKILEIFSVNCTFDMAKKVINIIREYDINKTNRILDNLKGNENINVRLMVKNYEDRYEK